MIAPAEKPRLIHLLVAGEGEDSLIIAGIRHKATNYRIKIELGGVTASSLPSLASNPPTFTSGSSAARPQPSSGKRASSTRAALSGVSNSPLRSSLRLLLLLANS
jgi:hypothetical protein